MKASNNSVCATLLLLASSAALALPVGMTEITIFDGEASGGVGTANEDQETETGMVMDQSWDLEGVYTYGANKLAMVGGFNFGNNLGGDRRSGDIFIDINGDHILGNVTTGGNGQSNVQNTFGYDYALDVNWSNQTYSIWQLSPGTITTTTTNYGANYGSNPWAYVSGGTNLGSGSFFIDNVLSNAQTGKTGGNHYAAYGFDLGFLGANVNYVTHFTSACGNDNLLGASTTVPLPAAAWLMGSGLLALAGLKRRKSN